MTIVDFKEYAKAVDHLDPYAKNSLVNHMMMLTKCHQHLPNNFAYNENRTWELLSNLNSIKQEAKLTQVAAIKRWVSQQPVDSALLELIEEDRELESEVSDIFSPSSNKRKFIENEPRKMRLVEAMNRRGKAGLKAKRVVVREEEEEVYKAQFDKLRRNDFRAISINKTNESVHNYVYNTYCEYQQHALDGTANTIDQGMRNTWRNIVKDEAAENCVGKYKTALYDIFEGNTEKLFATICDTWEDVIWVYLNHKVESMLYNPNVLDDEPFVPPYITALAASKDAVMDSDDPRRVFHLIQGAILSENIREALEIIDLALSTGKLKTPNKIKNFRISPKQEFRAHMLKFLSTFIVYGYVYYGWEEDRSSLNIISRFIKLNSEGDFFNPNVVAAYTARLSPKIQVQMYSDFLQKFRGDDEECSVLILLGKEHKFDMEAVLQRTFDQLYEKTITANANILESKVSEGQPTFILNGEMNENDEVLLQAVKWLVYDQLMCLQAFAAANMVMRYYFSTCNIYMILKISAIFPSELVERMKNGVSKSPIYKEFQTNMTLVTSIVGYEEYRKLLDDKPEEDDDTYETVHKISQWEVKIMELATKLKYSMENFLSSKWLEDEEETDAKELLRKMYFPYIVIVYHQTLFSSGRLLPSNWETASALPITITKNKSLFEVLKKANKMEQVLNELTKSL